MYCVFVIYGGLYYIELVHRKYSVNYGLVERYINNTQYMLAYIDKLHTECAELKQRVDELEKNNVVNLF